MPGQNASSGGIPRNRTCASFPTPNPQVLPTRSKGQDRNNRDTEILFMPLSYRKHRPATQNNRDTGGVLPQKAKQPGRSPESGIASRKPQGGSPRVAAPRVESPPGSPKEGLPSQASAQEGAGLQSSGTARSAHNRLQARRLPLHMTRSDRKEGKMHCGNFCFG